jgi:hypothetical protein
MDHRLIHLDNVSLLIVPNGFANGNIMEKCKFHFSTRYRNWVKRIPCNMVSENYVKTLLSDVERKRNEYMKRYKFLPHKENVQHSLIKVFDEAKLPNDICQKIANNISYDCKCAQNYVCSMCTHACCPKVVKRFCVCTIAFSCPDHGYTCVGSHD